jgi:hypothetical protein
MDYVLAQSVNIRKEGLHISDFELGQLLLIVFKNIFYFQSRVHFVYSTITSVSTHFLQVSELGTLTLTSFI